MKIISNAQSFKALFILVALMSMTLVSCKDQDSEDLIPTSRDQRIDDSIFSAYVNDDYPMKIFIPKEYEEDKNLPVVYLLDGLLASPLDDVIFFDEVIGSMQAIGLKAILVAVGDETGVDREIDYLAQGCQGTDEGFSNFYNFITEELVPYIDGKYENNVSARTLIGHSHAGNFAYNAFFREDPNDIIFQGYIASDPSRCDVTIMESHLDSMGFPEGTNFKMHLSQVQFDVETLHNLLVEKDFPFLDIDFKIYTDEDHVTVTRPSIRRGLDFIY